MIKLEDSGRSAHDRRVGAYCDEIANVLGIAPADREMLRRIALRGCSHLTMKSNGLQNFFGTLGWRLLKQ